MMGSKLLAWTAALAIICGVSHLAPAVAADNEPADVNGEASSPSPRSPIRVSVVDYEKAEEGPGTLKMSGTAIADNTVYVYVDGKPSARSRPPTTANGASRTRRPSTTGFTRFVSSSSTRRRRS